MTLLGPPFGTRNAVDLVEINEAFAAVGHGSSGRLVLVA
jgi:hypothetical protein